MGHQTEQSDAARHIRADHLRLALRSARPSIESKLGRLCAMSNGGWSTNDGNGHRNSKAFREDIDTRRAVPPLLLPLHFSLISENIVRRVRLNYGLPEVKRTWGVGYKALLKELTSWRAA